jgi:uncharacterized protein
MVIRRSKKATKKVPAKKTVTGSRRRAASRVAKKKSPVFKEYPSPVSIHKDMYGAPEVAVESTKFTHPEPARTRKVTPQELPYEYGRDTLVLQVRDPWWLYAYWELRADTINTIREKMKEAFASSRRVLRVYDVTAILFDGANAHRFFDIYLPEHAREWYVDVGEPGRSWCADYGLLLPDGTFLTILRSNVIQTPLAGPSGITDEEWAIPEEIFARLYGAGFGFGQSSPVGKAWQERMQKALFSGILSSPGITSGAPASTQRKFWLRVDCELIVYGATQPDAAVTVQGKPIRLRSDGTFTLRFALPDGKQVLPVTAVSSDEVEERTITPSVSRVTTFHETLKKSFSRTVK